MEPTGTIREYKPTWRERAANALADLVEGMGADRWKANKIAQTLLGGERSNLPAGMGLSDMAALGVVPGAPAALRAASVPAGLLNYADASKEGNPFSALTVWHGSPHKFDKFDSAHIGRGEGAQAYGHGLYLADAPAVGGEYIRAGRNVGFENWDDVGRLADKAFAQAKGDKSKAIEFLTALSASSSGKSKQINIDLAKQAIESGNHRASLYKVDLPDNLITRMLDWDKPLSHQDPSVAAKAKAALDAKYGAGTFDSFAASGGDLRDLVQNFDDLGRGGMEAMFRKQGIPGIRYLDGGSRGAGQGTYNYVVFPGEENALTILERNGNPIQRLAR